MKKLIFAVAVALCVVSCSTYTYTPTVTMPTPKSKHTGTAEYRSINLQTPITSPLIVDLEVSQKKISHTYVPTKDVLADGKDNVINMAVTEALLEKGGNADVLIGMQHQIKYSTTGDISSVIVSGYPARYVRFRHPDQESIWLNESTFKKEVKSPSKVTK